MKIALQGPRAFLIAVWAIGFGFLAFRLGLQNDDWAYVLRNPEHDTVERLIQSDHMHFFRPLYRVVVPAFWTLFADHSCIPHLLTGLVHGMCAVSLYRLIKSLGGELTSAMIAALIYLVYPVHEQLMFWPTAIGTSLAIWGAAEALRWCARRRWFNAAGDLRTPHRDGAGGELSAVFLYDRMPRFFAEGVRVGLALGAAAFILAGLNEQPAMLMLAAPLIVLLRSGGPARWRLIRAGIVGAPVVAALGYYTLCHTIASSPPPATGWGSVVKPDDMPRRLYGMLETIGEDMWLHEWATGAFWTGWRTISTHPWRLAASVAALAACAPSWWRWAWARPTVSWKAGAGLLVVGLAIVVLAWLPIARVWYAMGSRLHGAPLVGLCLMLGGAGSVLGASFGEATLRVLRTWALAAMLVATPVCLLMLIGTQRAYQDRWQRDRNELEQLRALVPDPPPNAIFVPVDIEMPVPVTGSTRFDFERRSVFASWWSSGWSVRRTFRRPDLDCTLGPP